MLPKLEPLSASPIDRLTRAGVEDLVAQIAAHTPGRAEMALSLLKRILRNAEERGQPVDPSVFRVRIGKAEEREPCLLTWDQVDDVQSWMPENIARIVPIAVLTMLRRGEILALRDQDIDFETGSIAVHAQNQYGQRVHTKTRAGRRTVDLGPVALRLLREQQLARVPNPDALLFPSSTGAAFDPNNLNHRAFKPTARHAGFPQLTFHDLRHTGASLMIAAVCHVRVIAEQMGHADGGTLVLKRYGHLYKGAKRQAALTTETHIFRSAADSDVGTAWGGTQTQRDIK